MVNIADTDDLNEIPSKGNNIKQQEVQLLLLERKIEKLRDALNEICIASDEVNVNELRLNASKHLDELIVDYMKKNMILKNGK